jgi:hypothetical protein
MERLSGLLGCLIEPIGQESFKIEIQLTKPFLIVAFATVNTATL